MPTVLAPQIPYEFDSGKDYTRERANVPLNLDEVGPRHRAPLLARLGWSESGGSAGRNSPRTHILVCAFLGRRPVGDGRLLHRLRLLRNRRTGLASAPGIRSSVDSDALENPDGLLPRSANVTTQTAPPDRRYPLLEYLDEYKGPPHEPQACVLLEDPTAYTEIAGYRELPGLEDGLIEVAVPDKPLRIFFHDLSHPLDLHGLPMRGEVEKLLRDNNVAVLDRRGRLLRYIDWVLIGKLWRILPRRFWPRRHAP